MAIFFYVITKQRIQLYPCKRKPLRASLAIVNVFQLAVMLVVARLPSLLLLHWKMYRRGIEWKLIVKAMMVFSASGRERKKERKFHSIEKSIMGFLLYFSNTLFLVATSPLHPFSIPLLYSYLYIFIESAPC